LQNLPGAAAMAEELLRLVPRAPGDAGPAAAEAARADALRRQLRGWLLAEVDDLDVHGPEEGTLPHLVAASALYVDGEALVEVLDRAGFAVHSGSSCATTSGEPSHVLVAMGALTHGHVRVSFGPDVGEDELRRFARELGAGVRSLRSRVGR
jgi:cysteine desulfurase